MLILCSDEILVTSMNTPVPLRHTLLKLFSHHAQVRYVQQKIQGACKSSWWTVRSQYDLILCNKLACACQSSLMHRSSYSAKSKEHCETASHNKVEASFEVDLASLCNEIIEVLNFCNFC